MAGRSAVQRDRVAKAARKLPRYYRLAGVTKGERALRLFEGSLLPASTFGAQPCGVSPARLRLLRRWASGALKPAIVGRSQKALFAVRGDPTAAALPLLPMEYFDVLLGQHAERPDHHNGRLRSPLSSCHNWLRKNARIKSLEP